MKKRSVLKHIIEVALSNCTTIASGIIVGFLIPKILSVEGYGFYKTFTLYMTYVSFFSLGIVDGIVLEYGGHDYNRLDKQLFRCYFNWYTAIHLFFCSIIIIAGLIINNIEYRFLFVILGINLVVTNYIGYFQQISQITQRFEEYSLRRVLQSILNIIVALVLYIMYICGKDVNYKYYIIGLTLVNLILALWYIYTYREITIGKTIKMSTRKSDVAGFIKMGFPLLFANLCSTLILTLDRQFVNVLFDTATYAVYAFAYNMLSLVTVATSAMATVLYPTLKRTTQDTMQENYDKLITVVLTAVFALELVYFPLKIFINWYLPEYSESLIIFRVVFPGLAISSSITVVMHNYYKVLGQNLRYFKKSVVILGISVIANIFAYSVWKTTISISIASIVTMLIWYVLIEDLFVKKYGYSRVKNLGYLIVMMGLFYFATGIESIILATLVYIGGFIIIFSIFNRTLMDGIIRKLKRKE